jgi:hypothetical protein
LPDHPISVGEDQIRLAPVAADLSRERPKELGARLVAT